MAVKKGDWVKIDYEGAFEDGTVFETSASGGPLDFVAGAGEIVRGLDNAVIGMEPGQEKTVRVEPKDGYGERNEEYIKSLPRNRVPNDNVLKPGMSFAIQMPDGVRLPVTIVGLTETEIRVDLNHPLAGKTIVFKIKVVETGPASERPKPPPCECGGGLGHGGHDAGGPDSCDEEHCGCGHEH